MIVSLAVLPWTMIAFFIFHLSAVSGIIKTAGFAGDNSYNLSAPAVAGLIQYEAGNYTDAAGDFRKHFKERFSHLVPEKEEFNGRLLLRLYLKNDLKKAADFSRRALDSEPSAPFPSLILGAISLENNKQDEALDYFSKILKSESAHPDALVLSGCALIQKGDYPGALSSFYAVLKAGQTRNIHTFTLYFLLESAGALHSLPKERQPSALLAIVHRMLLVFDPSQEKNAIAYARRAVQAGDHPAEAWNTIGIAYEKGGLRKKAIEAYGKASAVDPKNVEAYAKASILYSEIGNLDQEEAMLKKAYEASQGEPYAGECLSCFLWRKKGDYAGAMEVNLKTLEKKPENLRAIYQLMELDNELGKYSDALVYGARGLLIAPNNTRIMEEMGRSYLKLNQRSEAKALFLKALSVDSDLPWAHRTLAVLYKEEQSYIDAIREYSLAFKGGYKNTWDMAQFCHLIEEEKAYQEAWNCYQAVLKIDPNYQDAKEGLQASEENLNSEGPIHE